MSLLFLMSPVLAYFEERNWVSMQDTNYSGFVGIIEGLTLSEAFSAASMFVIRSWPDATAACWNIGMKGIGAY